MNSVAILERFPQVLSKTNPATINQAILLKDIAKLANNSIAYEVNYNCFDWVDQLIGTT